MKGKRGGSITGERKVDGLGDEACEGEEGMKQDITVLSSPEVSAAT